jgi:hypothetical protein
MPDFSGIIINFLFLAIGYLAATIINPYFSKKAENVASKEDAKQIALLERLGEKLGEKEFDTFTTLLGELDRLHAASLNLQLRQSRDDRKEKELKSELFEDLRSKLQEFETALESNHGLLPDKIYRSGQNIYLLTVAQLNQYDFCDPEDRSDPNWKKYHLTESIARQNLSSAIVELRKQMLGHWGVQSERMPSTSYDLS